jgi:hypothetical protein
MAGAKTPAQQEILQRFAALVAQDWAGDVVTAAVWDALIVELETISARAWARAGAWARAWARAGTWAETGTWAWAWARARAGAGARARARAGAYEKLSEQTIHLLQTAPQPTKVQR